MDIIHALRQPERHSYQTDKTQMQIVKGTHTPPFRDLLRGCYGNDPVKMAVAKGD